MEFKDIVRKLRTDRGWTQEQLAERLGLTKMTISQYETGARNPSFQRIEAIADVFHVDMNYLLGHKDIVVRMSGDETDPAPTDSIPVMISPIEIEMINAYRHASDEAKHIILYTLKLGENKK